MQPAINFSLSPEQEKKLALLFANSAKAPPGYFYQLIWADPNVNSNENQVYWKLFFDLGY